MVCTEAAMGNLSDRQNFVLAYTLSLVSLNAYCLDEVINWVILEIVGESVPSLD